MNILLVHIDFRYLQMIYGISNQFFPNSCASIIIGNILHSFKNAHLNILQSICYKVYSFNRETNKEQKIGIKVISCFSICTLFLSFRLFAFRVHSEQFYLLSSFEEFAPNFN